MSFTQQSEFDRLRQAAIDLTHEQRQALTWDSARQYVAPDTLHLAEWQGLTKRCGSPWEALATLLELTPHRA